jgi:hypothetical protein
MPTSVAVGSCAELPRKLSIGPPSGFWSQLGPIISSGARPFSNMVEARTLAGVGGESGPSDEVFNLHPSLDPPVHIPRNRLSCTYQAAVSADWNTDGVAEAKFAVQPNDEPAKIYLEGGNRNPCGAPSEFGDHADGATSFESRRDCRWHKSAGTVGIVSDDGHVFTKFNCDNTRKVRTNSRGTVMELSKICMVFDESLRCRGSHQFNYKILHGQVGRADGAGFVFDSQLRRNNIQRMRSVFLNQRGCICFRDHQTVSNLGAQLPPLTAGMFLALRIDLDRLSLSFTVSSSDGFVTGVAEVSLEDFFLSVQKMAGTPPPRSGFFCAVLTKDISVSLT